MTKQSKPKFWFNASLRIHDAPEFHDDLTARLGRPTHCHKKGEPKPKSPPAKHPWPNDIWIRESPLPEKQDIGDHLGWIADFARPHSNYLRRIIRRGARIDIYMSYRSDHDHCGFAIDPQHLELFVRLGIRLEVSVMT